jgi:hypothetical protein
METTKLVVYSAYAAYIEMQATVSAFAVIWLYHIYHEFLTGRLRFTILL